ncbi:MAG TPA: MarR family transcriptional regulator [Chloroflexi bacterium]|nr:MarR family transcriptional regulator [Chloroflexota bacterium]
MTAKVESERLVLRLWFLLHRTRDALRSCEDKIFDKYGLTTEHYAVLSVMKLLDGRVRLVDLARWLERSPNSVSMIVDRMVKAGLVRRVRDKSDRRVVHVVFTNKGENALKPATMAGWEFIQEILSPLSYEDRHTLARLLETLKYRAVGYLNPGTDIEEMKKDDITSRPDLMERLCQYISASTTEDKSSP